MKKTWLVLAGLLCANAFALSVNHAEYDRERRVVELFVSYCYNEVEPSIEVLPGLCLETSPLQCSIDVSVKGEELRPEDNPSTCVLNWIDYPVDEQQLPAYLTFKGNDDSEVRIYVD